jgi:hypothetical protein
MEQRQLGDLHGTTWTGNAELWLDPLGDTPARSACTVTVDRDGWTYTWSHEGTPHHGSVRLREGGADFTDTFHQPEPMACRAVAGARGLSQVEGAYGPDAEWGWRIGLCLRAPTGELVLQMTNVAPWGEEARAVRMVCKRA